MRFAHCGRHFTGESNLVDCQGNALSISGLREFRFIMQTVDGKTICFMEIGHHPSLILWLHLDDFSKMAGESMVVA